MTVSSEELRHHYRQCGIPDRFHAARLRELGDAGGKVADWLAADGFARVRDEGHGLTFLGDDTVFPVLMATAKACSLKGISVFVTSVPMLVQYVTQASPTQFQDAEAIFITGFWDNSYTEIPVPPWDKYQVEQYLLEFLNDNGSVSIHGFCKATADIKWSNLLMRKIHKHNEVVQV